MTVRELIEKLSAFDQDAIVVQSKDAEGNGYSPTYAVEERCYVADSTYSGELVDDEETEDGVPAAVLWPTN